MASYKQQGYRPQQPEAMNRGGKGALPPRTRSKAKKKKPNRPFRVFLLLILFALLATAGVMGYMIYEEVETVEKASTFYPGIYIDDIQLHGMSTQEAAQMLYNKALAELEQFQVALSYGEMQWSLNAAMLGMSTSLVERVETEVLKAFQVGREGNSIIDRYQAIVALKETPYAAYTSGASQNVGVIDLLISEIQAAVYVSPQDATQSFDTAKQYAYQVESEKLGIDVDRDALRAQLIDMTNKLQSGVVNVPTKQIEPVMTRAMLDNQMTRLADQSTPINKNSTEDRTYNVQHGASQFDGMIIKPGQKVSFNSITGKRTLKNGYREALQIEYGQYEMGVGGGICQVSTTLYKAVMEAGLEVVSRTNHAVPVNYAEMGYDATVMDDRIDFVFRNNTDQPIQIVARTLQNGSKKECQFQIYGRPHPNGYSFGIQTETVEEIPIPEPTIVPDKNREHVHYVDQTKQVTKGAVGYIVDSYLVTKDANGAEVDRRHIARDTYKATAPRVYQGVEKRD